MTHNNDMGAHRPHVVYSLENIMKRILIGVGATLIAAAVGWVANERWSTGAKSRAQATTGEDVQVELPQKQRVSRRQPTASASHSEEIPSAIDAPTEDAVQVSATEEDPSDSESEKSPPRITAEELAFNFDSEAGRRDLVEVEGAIERTVVQVNMPGAKLEKVECRATMCRAAFRFDEHGTEKDFLKKFLFPKDRNADTRRYGSMSGIIPQREEHEDGSRGLVMYLRQPG